MIVIGHKTRCITNGAIDVKHQSAVTTDQVVMVVTDSLLVAGRRPGRLDTPDEALVDQNAEGVVHPLARDGTDLGPDHLRYIVCGAVRSFGHRPQDGQPLGRDLDTVLAK